MTTACPTCGRCAAPADRPGAATRLLAPPLRALARALGRRRRRRDATRLLDLDDHLLADIGVTRDEARRMLRGDRPPRRPDWPGPPALAARIGAP